MTSLRWAAPTPDDDEQWLVLLAAMEEVDRRGETLEAQDLADERASVWANPATDSVFVWDGPQLVAFGWIKTMAGQRSSHRLALWGGVHPSHRRRGLGAAVLSWQIRRASVVATTLDPSLPVCLEMDAADNQLGVLALAAETGFTPQRRFLEVARPTSLPVPPVRAPDGLELVEWSAEIDERLRAAHADSFADHWGSEPRSREEWEQWYTGHRAFRPDLSVAAVDRNTGEIASFVLTAAYPQDWVAGVVPVEAWINTVGTVKPWRGRGAARWVLSEVLARIAEADTGFEQAILGVDAANPTGALALYRSLGFEDLRAVTTLRRPPDRTT